MANNKIDKLPCEKYISEGVFLFDRTSSQLQHATNKSKISLFGNPCCAQIQ